MPVDTRHPLYTEMLPRWRRCRDIHDGEDAVKAAGKLYLPRPGGLSDDEYAAYIERAAFYEAVGRTIEGFVGAVSRKAPTTNVPTQLAPMIADVTADGMTLGELIKRMCAEVILQGRGGCLVDYRENTQRANIAFYRCEDITNWGDDFVVLREIVYESDQNDRFAQVAIEQYRELCMVDGVYTVQLWRKSKSDNNAGLEWAPYGPVIVPTKRGVPFAEMPWSWVTHMGRTSKVEKPPLLGLVNVCVGHYRNSADLEHGLHFTGLPTLYVIGVSDSDGPIHVGSLSAITVADPQAKIGYAEFTGVGLSSLAEEIERKQARMAVLGASVFHDPKKGVEAAETARIRTSGEASLLSATVTAVEEAIRAAFTIAAEWMGAAGAVEITLNRDYIDTTLDGPTLTALVMAYQSGGLSLAQFLFNLQQGDLLAPATDLIEEQAVVEKELKAKQDALAAAGRPPGQVKGSQEPDGE